MEIKVTETKVEAPELPALYRCKNGGMIALITERKGDKLKGVVLDGGDGRHAVGRILTSATVTHWAPFEGSITLSSN